MSHDVFIQSGEFEQNYEGMKLFAQYMSSRSYYFGANSTVTILGLYVLNLNYHITLLIASISYITTLVFIKNNEFFSAIFKDYTFGSFFSVMVVFTLSYLDTKA